jgi:stress response protein YsnF
MTLSNDKRSEINSAELYQISLLEEKLQVSRRKEKVGEVVIRKQFETRMISIPLRRGGSS